MPLLTLILLLVPSLAFAQAIDNFVPLVGIPFVETDTVGSLGEYVNAIYLAAISIAAFLAVIKIIFAGVQYMLSEVVTSKEAAKKSIYGAVIGLLIVLGAFLILNTINPQLTSLTNLDGPNLAGGDVNDSFEGVPDPVAEMCNSELGCSIQNCSFFRTELTCRDWCINRSGGYIDSGVFWKSDKCAFQITSNQLVNDCNASLTTRWNNVTESCEEINLDEDFVISP